MKFLALSLVAILFTLSCFSQREVNLEEVANHVGDSVTVRGKIFGIRYLEQGKNTPTFINIGAAYPDQLLTIVIWGDVRKKLAYIPNEKTDVGAMAVVAGKVELYKDKPQIVITDSAQLIILKDEEVPSSQLPPPTNKGLY